MPQRFAQRAAELGVAQRVHLLGQVSEADKYAALAIADAFVSTSQHEGFGLVFLEAMACGLPVVCYDRGGQTDFLTSGETGFVVQAQRRRSLSARRCVQFMPTFICDAPWANGTGSWSKTISSTAAPPAMRRCSQPRSVDVWQRNAA